MAYEPKRLHRYDRVLVPMTSDLIGWSDNYLPHFERLPTEVQHSLICHFERLSMNRFLAARERTAALQRAGSLKERLARANEASA